MNTAILPVKDAPQKPFFFSLFSLGASPHIIERDICILDLPDGLNGKRIVFASDIHLSWMYPKHALVRIIERIRALQPDIMIWGGDYSETRKGTLSFFELAARINAPLGSYGVVGNNDHENFKGNMSQLQLLAKGAGIQILVNHRAIRIVDGGRLIVFGSDDDMYGVPSGQMMRGDSMKHDFRLLITHEPQSLDVILRDAEKPPHLALAGHTHGGQIALGSLSPYRIKYEARLIKRSQFFRVTGTWACGDMLFVVSNGIGTSRLPLRVSAAPQLHVFTLKRMNAEN